MITHFAQLKILKPVGTHFYPSFDLRRPMETSTRPRPIALGEQLPLKRIDKYYGLLTRSIYSTIIP